MTLPFQSTSLRVTFAGGAETVTGSNFLVEYAPAGGGSASGGRILIDCGLEQGSDFSVEAMYGPFPYDPKTIDALANANLQISEGLLEKRSA